MGPRAELLLAVDETYICVRGKWHYLYRAVDRYGKDGRFSLVRNCPYLNNVVEQDHRAIKRRYAAMLGFKSFGNAAVTLAGIELAHRIPSARHEGQRRGAWHYPAPRLCK